MFENLKRQRESRLARGRLAARGRRRGVTMLVMAAGIIFICGCASLAVDYGLLVNDKNQSQRGVDAAALGGAQELKKTGDDAADTANARRVAIAIAGQNGVTVTPDKVTFLEDNTKVRVEASSTRALYFARVIGISTGTVGAFAIAGVSVQGASPLVVPIGITQSTLDLYTQPQLSPLPIPLGLPRVVDELYRTDHFLVFDLRPGGKSPPQMYNQLVNGYAETQIGDMLTSLNASAEQAPMNKFRDALADRFQRSAQAPWNDTWTGQLSSSIGIRFDEILSGSARADNPRVMNFVMNPGGGPSGGTTKHEVLATTPVYVQGWQNDQLLVRFLPSTFGVGNVDGAGTISLLQ